jgi:hypothetical protein
VAVLLEAEGGEGVGRAGDGGTSGTESQLARQQVRAGEREGVGEQEHQVVADDGRVGALPDQSGGRVADERVGERERVAERPELVGVEEVQRLVDERVAVPCHLVRLRQRVTEVLRDVAAQVQDQRPVHDHGHQAGAHDQSADLASGDLRGP